MASNSYFSTTSILLSNTLGNVIGLAPTSVQSICQLMPPPTSCWRPSHDSFFDIRVGRLKPRILDEPAVTGLLSLYVSLWQLMSLPFLSAVFRERTFLTIRCLFPTTLGISIPTIKANQPRSLARLWCGWLRCPPKSGHAHQSRVLATVFLD